MLLYNGLTASMALINTATFGHFYHVFIETVKRTSSVAINQCLICVLSKVSQSVFGFYIHENVHSVNLCITIRKRQADEFRSHRIVKTDRPLINVKLLNPLFFQFTRQQPPVLSHRRSLCTLKR